MTEAWAVSVNYADPSFGFDNQSSVDVTFYGSGFHDGMTVKLDKHWHHGSHATLWPLSGVHVVSDSELRVSFNLSGAYLANYTLWVDDAWRNNGFEVRDADGLWVSSISPNRGATNRPPVATTITGNTFQSGSRPMLQKQIVNNDKGVQWYTIYPTSTTFVSSTELQATFDLAGQPTGYWDVVVKQPNGTHYSLTSAFEVVVAPTPPDTTPPTIIPPADVTAEQANRDGTAVSLGSPQVSDDRDPNPTVTNDAPAVFPLGFTTVTWTATDAAGNTATATQVVTIVDTTPPTLTLPGNITGVEQTCAGGTYVDFAATATDLCDAAPAVVCVPPSGTEFPLGTTMVTVTATDISANVATGTFTVTVVDTSAPQFTAPPDVTAEQTSRDGTPVELGAPTAADACDASPTVTNDAPAVFPLGTTIVTWTVKDASGNVATTTQKVTIVDTTKPELTVPAAVTTEQTNHDGTPVEIGAATATDICDADVAITNDAPAVFPLGETVVTWTATDDAGNSVSATQKVTIVDTTKPTLTVPDDVIAEQTSADGTPVDTGQATATDICDTDVAITNDAPAVFPLGETIVTWTATDDTGNVVTATQKVTIVDTTAPVIANVAANPGTLWPVNHKLVSVAVSAQLTDICDAAPTWRITGVTCNQPVNGPGDGNTQPDWQITGDHTVKLRAERSGKTGDRIYTIWIAATDASGNSATASCTVVVPHDQGGGKK